MKMRLVEHDIMSSEVVLRKVNISEQVNNVCDRKEIVTFRADHVNFLMMPIIHLII